ncbi:MFS transporter [Nocardia sp. 004]|uniref:MFS transporter n=1 Tax=Nocardia sp. 004 TaxID=3385978 RepID=UPI0039A01566
MTETIEAPALSTRRRWTVLAICASALFLVGLDTTIVTVGLSEIGHGLGVGEQRTAWLVDAYTVTFASLLVTAGAVADRFGRRRVFQTGLVVFALSSLACAMAPTAEFLVAARVVQGIGASMLSPVALAIVVNAMPDPRERAQAIGVWGAMFGLSMAVGPVTGGALIGLFGWRAVFWINVPVVLIAFVLVRALVPESRGPRPRRLDMPGQLLLIALLWITVATLIEGPRLGWTAPIVLGGYAALILLGVVFVRVESRVDQPLIEPGLFLIPSFAGAILGAVAVFVAFSVTLLTTTLFLQHVHGWTPVVAGAATLPMAVTATLCAPLSGYLVGRIGPRTPLLLAGACLTAGGVLLLGLGNGPLLPVLVAAYLCIGAGVGFANAPITDTAVGGLPPHRAGVASGTASTARQLGTALGIALAGSAVAAAPTEDFLTAALPALLTVTACGIILLVVADAAKGRPRNSQPEQSATSPDR